MARMGLGLPVVVRDVMTVNNITLHEISHTDYLAIVEHAMVSMPNGYVYVHNNPVSWVDPWGLDYIDANVNVALFFGTLFGLTGGFMADTEGIVWYAGAGFMTSSGASLTWSPNDITPNVASIELAGSLGGPAGAVGTPDLVCDGGLFSEGYWSVGIGLPGASLTGFWTFSKSKWGDPPLRGPQPTRQP